MLRAAVALAATAFPAVAQPQPSALTFEAATIKPAQPNGGRGGIRPSPGGERYLATGMPVRMLLMVAWRVKPQQITGGPAWLDSDLWDMNAKAERPSTIEDLHTMLASLLVERFQLKFHRETRELPVYALSVDKAGPKLKAHASSNAGEPWIDQAVDKVTHVKMTATSADMPFFAWRLAQQLDRPVLDRTSLSGGYDFTLTYTRELPPGMPEGAMLNGVPIDTSGPNIFEALRQQLGLELKPQKGPAEVYVIDSAAKPVE